jgi:deoxyuridine 5'-triphosphate nucleotidohydrolase
MDDFQPLQYQSLSSLRSFAVGENDDGSANVTFCNKEIELKVMKTHPKAKLPKRAHSSDSGYDIYSVEDAVVPARGSVVVPVGLQLSYITPGYWFRVEPRSGLGFKRNIQPHLGIIDNGYRGDLGIKLYNFSDANVTLTEGSRIAQLVLYPHITATISEADKIDATERGEAGFGSTG